MIHARLESQELTNQANILHPQRIEMMSNSKSVLQKCKLLLSANQYEFIINICFYQFPLQESYARVMAGRYCNTIVQPNILE